MARGRAFDLDASDSGTVGASSSTQPPVPPSLPSIPSSSTSLPGPVESSPASQSPTALGCEKVIRSSSACLKRYRRAGKRLGRILHSRESVRYLHKIGAVRLAVMEQDLLNTQAEKYGCELTPMEVFTYTHTKDHDGNTFVDRRALGINPLPSPLDPDTVDDTLVTPADTTTHPAGTPPGNTTLDCADDQPRRFDFGPF
ncbi:hypothetical protein JCGZ_03159 [Jatropha curcas]|uniref:Uncharacterized protein n=1 Tax=Jatropha curcas TaxID=180498 RepID=A0A067L1D1_JATCU|nr:hypothetical protein JCGZ_03159 [Jatropha curcas]